MQCDVLEKKIKFCHYFCCAIEHVVAEHLSLSPPRRFVSLRGLCAPAFGSGSGVTKPESAKTDACPNGRGLKMINIKGLPERVLPQKKVVFKDLVPQSSEPVNTGAGVGRSPAARVYEQTSFARCAVVGNGGILKTASTVARSTRTRPCFAPIKHP